MILAFRKEFPWGEPTRFEEKILSGKKLHTIRDKNCRVMPGMQLQMAYGVRTKNYRQFNKGIEHLDVCTNRQEIAIRNVPLIGGAWRTEVDVDGKRLTGDEVCQLVENDGLTWHDFQQFFVPEIDTVFVGYIIHWTDLKY